MVDTDRETGGITRKYSKLFLGETATLGERAGRYINRIARGTFREISPDDEGLIYPGVTEALEKGFKDHVSKINNTSRRSNVQVSLPFLSQSILSGRALDGGLHNRTCRIAQLISRAARDTFPRRSVA